MTQYTFSEVEAKDPPPLAHSCAVANTVVNSHANPVGPTSSHPSIPSTTICLTISIYHWPISKVIKNKIRNIRIAIWFTPFIFFCSRICLFSFDSFNFAWISFLHYWVYVCYTVAKVSLSDDIKEINGWTMILAWWVIYPISWGQTVLCTEGQCHNKVMETVMIRAITSK